MQHNNQSKRKFLALFLSTIMICSAGAALASCSDTDSSSSSSSSSTTTKVDNGVIKNAGFEMDDYKESTPIITSVNSWTRSVNSVTSGSALSSKTASGVIDTTKWTDLTKANFDGEDFSTWTEEKAEKEWKNMSLKDKLAYYEAWEDTNEDDDKELEDLDFYESFNIDLEDIPDCANPKTHANIKLLPDLYTYDEHKIINTETVFQANGEKRLEIPSPKRVADSASAIPSSNPHLNFNPFLVIALPAISVTADISTVITLTSIRFSITVCRTVFPRNTKSRVERAVNATTSARGVILAFL